MGVMVWQGQWAGATAIGAWGLFAMPRVLLLSLQPLGRPQGAPAPGIGVLPAARWDSMGEEGVVLLGHLGMPGTLQTPSIALLLCRAARTPLLSQQQLLPPGRA